MKTYSSETQRVSDAVALDEGSRKKKKLSHSHLGQMFLGTKQKAPVSKSQKRKGAKWTQSTC